MNEIFEEIKKAERIAISGHLRPDGDCFGACLGLYEYLKQNYETKQAEVFLQYVPETFHILHDTNQINTQYPDRPGYDLFISLDCGDTERLGEAVKYFNDAAMTINIDHHISNINFAKLNYVKTDASSTSEILFYLMDENKINLEAAEALYLGIVHDTGIFKHSNTTRETFYAAGVLVQKGVPFSRIIDETFYQKTFIQNQILGRCLLESMLVLDGRCIVSALSKKTMDFYGVTSKDIDGIIDQLRVTKGVETAIFLYESNVREYKVSLRANHLVDVSKIAVYFGGGGHVKAAGCTMTGTMHDVINNLTKHIERQLDEQDQE